MFDEIEFCPAARAAIKYLVEDGRYDYLETGSLLGMKMSTKKKLNKDEKKEDYPGAFGRGEHSDASHGLRGVPVGNG